MWLDHKRADRVPTVLVQEALRNKGFTPGHADGRFGVSTARAVVAFQKANDLAPTGAVDDSLYAAIITISKPKAKAAPKKKEAAAAPTEPTPEPVAAEAAPAKKKPAAKKPAAKKVD
jgi:peptidoglycan hydrolase-like protein with peptidoglycan-binding domain